MKLNAASANWSCKDSSLQKGCVHSFSILLSTTKHGKRLAQSHQNKFLTNNYSPAVASFKRKTTSAPFKVLDGEVDTSSKAFQENHEHCTELDECVQQLMGFVSQGGGEKGDEDAR